MNKKIKFIGTAAAALLAVTPIVATSVTSTNTASAATYLTAADYTSYFTYNGQKLTVPSARLYGNGNGLEISTGTTTLQALLDKLESLVKFHGGSSSDKITTTTSDIYNQLTNQNISVSKNAPDGVVTIPEKDFVLSLDGSDPNPKLQTVSVTFNMHPVAPTTSPVIRVNYTQNGVDVNDVVQNQIFQIAPNSEFDPTDFVGSNGTRYKFSATASSSSDVSVKVTGDGSEVDTSKPGSHYKVTLTATNSEGKETKASYTVLVQPTGLYRIYAPKSTYIHWYSRPGNNGEAGSTISNGTQMYIGSKTQIIEGQSYTQFSEKSQADADGDSGRWLLTSDLLSDKPAPEVVTKTIMHKALVYDAGGGSKFRKLAAYSKVTVNKETVTIKGQQYYKVADAPDYIKASNIDGTVRTLKHNAYIYATSTRRANRTTLKKGAKIRTYGGSYTFKNGKKYYRIEGATKTKKMYVKVANFK